MNPQINAESVQEALQKANELRNQINKTKKDIEGIEQNINKINDLSIQADKEINRLPNNKKVKSAKILKLQNIDIPLLSLYNLRDNLNLDLKHFSKIIKDEEYIISKQTLSAALVEKQQNIENDIKNYQEQLATVDRATNVKKVEIKQKLKTKQIKIKSLKGQKTAVIQRLKALSKSGALIVLPIVTNIIVGKLIDIVLNISSLNEEVDKLNIEIENYNQSPDPIVKNILIARKNALLKKINQTEKIIKDVKSAVDILQILITIFQITIAALSAIPIPPIPAIQRAKTILNAISVILNIISPLLEKIINELEDIKARINDIENQLEYNAITNTNTTSFSQSLILPKQLGTLPDTYKGFKFAIKEENQLGAPSINGIKRHYGVAMDGSGIEVLKTDPSFTQDTEVLLDQLKFIINSQNLKA